MTTVTRYWLLALSTGLASTSLMACRSSAPTTAEIPVVPVASVGPAKLENNLVLSAEFEPFQDVDVMAKVAGYVRSIRVDIGSHVRQGDILAVYQKSRTI